MTEETQHSEKVQIVREWVKAGVSVVAVTGLCAILWRAIEALAQVCGV